MRGADERTRQDSGPQARERLTMNRLKSEEGEVQYALNREFRQFNFRSWENSTNRAERLTLAAAPARAGQIGWFRSVLRCNHPEQHVSRWEKSLSAAGFFVRFSAS